jgi:hypothetical protein
MARYHDALVDSDAGVAHRFFHKNCQFVSGQSFSICILGGGVTDCSRVRRVVQLRILYVLTDSVGQCGVMEADSAAS